MTDRPDPTRGIYGISVAADLVGTGVQNLRVYERRGLVEPARTDGGTRLYSDQDIERLRRIALLLGEGLNLAGIAMVLDLEADNARLRARAATSYAWRAIGLRTYDVPVGGRRDGPAGPVGSLRVEPPTPEYR